MTFEVAQRSADLLNSSKLGRLVLRLENLQASRKRRKHDHFFRDMRTVLRTMLAHASVNIRQPPVKVVSGAVCIIKFISKAKAEYKTYLRSFKS